MTTKKLKNVTYLSQQEKYLTKSLTTVVGLLEKVGDEVLKQGKAIDKLNTEIAELKNPKMFNIKRGNPFNEGTN